MVFRDDDRRTNTRLAFARFSLAACALAFVPACSERKLIPVEEDTPQVVDDQVDVELDFCTRRASEVSFPVKLLLVVDGSGSLQFTDQPNRRATAVRDLMAQLQTQPDVYVATMVFGSNIYVDPPISPNGGPMFIPALDWQEPPFLTVAEIQTNYHGAFSAIRSHLLSDMLDSDPAELARTKYVVVFFSDGAPTPKCCISAEETIGTLGELPFGCAPEAWETETAGARYCEGEEEQAICNDVDWLENFRDANTSGQGPDYGDGTLAALNELEPNDNYNRTYQVEDLVLEMVELAETFGVGEFRLHTALLFDSTLPDLVKQIYRLNRCKSESLLRRLAELGNGVFRDFENSNEIDFLSFNFTSLQRTYGLLANYVTNASSLPFEAGFIPDSDGDGLSDAKEFEMGTGVALSDSDRLASQPTITEAPQELPPAEWGDGYDDHIENDYSSTGFDPRYTSLPVTACPDFDPVGIDRADLDADGLNGCEEYLFETDRERADTDADGFPDGLEVRWGLNPIEHEGSRDDDFDGIENSRELRRGSNPLVLDATDREGLAYRYELIERAPTDDGRACYTSVVQGVRLVTTEPRIEGGRRGYNDLFFWIAEVPTDNPNGQSDLRFACFRAQYIAPYFKNPAQGVVRLTEEDLYDLSFDEHVERLRAGEDPCRGNAVQ